MLDLIEVVHAGGVISDAPSLSDIGSKILSFLLRLFGILGIIALIIVGLRYLSSSGDEKAAEKAKKAMVYVITGILVGLGALIIVRQIIGFFE